MTHQAALPRPIASRELDPDPSDQDLLARIGESQGGYDAFTTLYKRHTALVYRTIAGFLGSKATHEDVRDTVADVWMRIWRSASAFKGESHFKTWAYSIARSTIIDRARRASGVNLHFVPAEQLDEVLTGLASQGDGEGSPEDRVDRERLRKLLLDCIAKLPPLAREVIVLSDIHDLSVPEIAKRLDVLEGTVKSRIHYGRRKLKEILRLCGAERFLGREGMEVDGLSRRQVELLGSKGISSLDDLADLSSADLIDLLGEGSITEAAADKVIMTARSSWFETELTSGPVVDGLSRDQLIRLGAKGIRTRKDLGDLSSDELLEKLGPGEITLADAERIVMTAREDQPGFQSGKRDLGL